ncbi:Putative iron-sulfur cluster assembly scaffold protein for SUF system, SufE2 [Caenispirillum salinarum AK4]|uniref:Putative iron-sulfur cluster assembly scaffold protein for SUF system, SufE2 n=1 Tax=Caenispirillum salinarum AK4 TaxID=1238182 RepID=K9HVT8_9PROT|nr:iron-sulfur cluster assembly scaffold protein [Caenispirillum salinarum]EKV32356.1 Putative iron-sulfur cluster assembly scaffold protein for SUF system, SufE2 [Caenispirillum salinarum AK4]
MSSETAMIDLFSDKLKEYSRQVREDRRLESPDASAEKVSRLCGSRITVDVALDDADRLTGFGYAVRACALGEAATAILAANAVGRSVEELDQVAEAMRAMLKEDGPLPGGDWQELEYLRLVRDLKSRHGSVMLPFDALRAALDDARAKRG